MDPQELANQGFVVNEYGEIEDDVERIGIEAEDAASGLEDVVNGIEDIGSGIEGVADGIDDDWEKELAENLDEGEGVIQPEVVNDLGGDVNDIRSYYQEREKKESVPVAHLSQQTPSSKSWLKRSRVAPMETDKEYELLRVFIDCGESRTLAYVSRIANLQVTTVSAIAKRNRWRERAADWDRETLAQRIRQAQGVRHQQHIQRLERYRKEQEVIGAQTTVTASRILALANRKLNEMIESEEQLTVRDLPAVLNAAAKLAETGKSLQATALGVDQLMVALDEADID